MRPEEDEVVSTLRTRPSLLQRVHEWDDTASWQEFYRLYRKLIYGLARRAGLSHADAEDVTQDVFRRVAETIHTFECDPSRGTFRGWLMNLTRWRVANRFTRQPQELKNQAHRAPDDTRVTDTINRLPDQTEMDKSWDDEWQRHVLDAACERLARRVKPLHYQAFDLYVRRDLPVLKVAAELGMNPGTVYLVGHRLKKQLKAEVERLRKQLG